MTQEERRKEVTDHHLQKKRILYQRFRKGGCLSFPDQ